MNITKANFGLAKTLKAVGDEESRLYALHITGTHTEITNGQMAIRMSHSPQEEFEFQPESPLNVCLHPDDAINIASSLGKEDGVRNIFPAGDGATVQVDFENGETRILKPVDAKYPNIHDVEPKTQTGFSLAVDPNQLIAVLQAFRTKKIDSVLLEFRGSDQIIRVRPAASLNPSDPEVSAVLMPQRAESVVDLPASVKAKSAVVVEFPNSDDMHQGSFQ